MTAKKKLIEMVCEGNSSRSELARLIGNKYIRDNDLLRDYQITSSGIYVSMPFSERIAKFSLEDLSSLIKVGMNEGFYNEKDTSEINNSLRNCNKENLLGYFLKSGKKFQDLEDFYREKSRLELGIIENFKEYKEQTKVNSRNIAVFTMDKNSRDFVRTMYHESGYNPLIEMLGEFATGNPALELTNNIVDNSYEKTYKRMVGQLKEYVPKVINHLQKEDNGR